MSGFLKKIRKKLSVGGPQLAQVAENITPKVRKSQSTTKTTEASQDVFHGSWDIFISHKQANGGPQCLALQTKLQLKYGLKVWLDVTMDNISKEAMLHGVRESSHFVIFVTDGVFDRPYCQMEIKEARRLQKHIAVLWERDPRHGGKLQVSELLDQVPGDLAFLKDVSWIEYNPHERFMRAAIETLLGQCNIQIADENVGQIFDLDFDPRLTPRQLQHEYMKGTRKWIIEAMEEWYTNRASGAQSNQVFMLLGLAGVGKSVLMSEVCRRGNADVFSRVPGEFDPQQAIIPVAAYHFFKHDNKRLSTARGCIISLAAQLRASIPEFREALDSQKSLSDDLLSTADLKELFRRFIAEPALELSSTTKPVVVLIDAVDECAENVELASIIENEWRAPGVPSWLMLLVSSRPDVFTKGSGLSNSSSQLNLGVTVLDTEDERNLQDVEEYLRHALAGKLEPGKEENTIKEIVERSQGLFLYFRFLPDLLAESQARQPDRGYVTVDDLSGFPSGLSGVYEKFFGRLHSALGKEDYRKLLSPLVSSREPLPKVIWMRCFGVDVTGSSEVNEDDDLDVFYPIEKHCNNLLYIPEDLSGVGNVRFVHKSMVEWISGGSRAKGNNAFKSAKHLHIREQLGHEALSLKCCLPMFLNHEDLDYAIDAMNFATRHVFYHLCKIGDIAAALPLLFELKHLMKRLVHDSPNNVANDAESLLINSQDKKIVPAMKNRKSEVLVVVKLLRLAFQALERDSRELPGQILGRIPLKSPTGDPLPEVLRNLVQAAAVYRPENGAPWWRPVLPYLETALPSPVLRIIQGHTSSINSVAMHGSTIVTASSDKTVRMFDADSGESMLGGRPILGHSKKVNAIDISPDGQWFASGGDDSIAFVRSLVTGESRYPKEDGKDRGLRAWGGQSVRTLRFSPDSKYLAVGHYTDIIVWDLETRKKRYKAITSHGQLVEGLAFSPDGLRIASVAVDRTLRMWNAETGEPLWNGLKVQNHSYFFSMAFSPDGKIIATGDEDQLVKLFRAEDGQPLIIGEGETNTLVGHTGTVVSLLFTSDSKHLISGSKDRTIRCWDMTTGKLATGMIPILRGHNGPVSGLAVSADGTKLVSSSYDQTVRIWDLRMNAKGGNVADADEYHKGSIRNAAFSCDRSFLATVSYDKTIRLWDTETGLPYRNCVKSVVTLSDTEFVSDIACHPKQRDILALVLGNEVKIYDIKKGEVIRSLESDLQRVKAVAFSNDGTLIACGGKMHLEDQIKIYKNDESMEQVHKTIHLIGLKGMVFSPNDKYIGSFGSKRDKYCKVTDVVTAKRVLNVNWRGEGEAVMVTFSGDSTKMYAHMSHGETTTYSISTCAVVPDISRQAAIMDSLEAPNQSAPLVNYSNNVVKSIDRLGINFAVDGGAELRHNSCIVRTSSGRLVAYVGQWSQVYLLSLQE